MLSLTWYCCVTSVKKVNMYRSENRNYLSKDRIHSWSCLCSCLRKNTHRVMQCDSVLKLHVTKKNYTHTCTDCCHRYRKSSPETSPSANMSDGLKRHSKGPGTGTVIHSVPAEQYFSVLCQCKKKLTLLNQATIDQRGFII